MNLLLETKRLTYINGVKEKTPEIKENGEMAAAAVVPAAVIGWQNIRHKIGF